MDPVTLEEDPAPPAVAVVGDDGGPGGRDAAALATALGARRLIRVDAADARAVHRAARLHDADLIALGSAGVGLVHRALHGDVPRGVLRGAPCPVAVADPGFATRGGPPRRIAVGYDGSAEAAGALAFAAMLSRALHAALALHVAWNEPSATVLAYTPMPDVDALRGEESAHAQRVLLRALADLPGSTAGIVHHGPPGKVLEEVGRSTDLLVVGCHGWGALHRLALGSTADRLIHHAPCAVLVVPRCAAVDAPVPDEAQQPAATTA